MEDLLSRIANYTPLIPWVAILIGGIFIERALPQGRALPRKDSMAANIINGTVVVVMAFFLMPAVTALTARLVQKMGGGFIDLRVPLHNEFLSQAVTALLFIFIYDFFFYFWHRAEHRFLFLWHIHAVHHSDTSFNITTYARQHWLEQILQGVFIGLTMAVLFKFTPAYFFSISMLMAIWNFFTHMNIKLDMRGFTKLVAGPQYHRIHHSIEREHQDVNFVQFFPLFDIAFSTYCQPQKNEYPVTGLYSGEAIDRPLDLFMWPFRKYWGYFKR
jgi:sterol desaturase/sphingolipid hydroxylase (fatty acid hydroxylase superfamily)